ncbi:MAG TPA: HigA family addiction module antitoxin [Acidobacteriaceae bacterium]
MRMHNPAHPGEILREYMDGLSVTSVAQHLDTTRVNLSRILHGRVGISAEMALRLSEAFGTSAEFWLNMQTSFDLWQVSQGRRKKIALVITRKDLKRSAA